MKVIFFLLETLVLLQESLFALKVVTMLGHRVEIANIIPLFEIRIYQYDLLLFQIL